MVHAEALHFVHGQEHSSQEELVFLLQRQSESVDNGTQDFEQLSDSVVAFCFVHELEEDVVDGSADV